MYREYFNPLEKQKGEIRSKSEITRQLSNTSVMIRNARDTPETYVLLGQHFLSLNVYVTTRVYAWPSLSSVFVACSNSLRINDDERARV